MNNTKLIIYNQSPIFLDDGNKMLFLRKYNCADFKPPLSFYSVANKKSERLSTIRLVVRFAKLCSESFLSNFPMQLFIVVFELNVAIQSCFTQNEWPNVLRALTAFFHPEFKTFISTTAIALLL